MTDPLDQLKIAKPGDILMTLGPWRLSQAIADRNEGFSHASIIIATEPLIWIAEAVPPRSRVLRYPDVHGDSKRVVLLHDRTLTDEQRFLVCNYAGKMLNRLYGLTSFPALILDQVFDTQRFGDALRLSKTVPVCTVLVAESRARIGLDFGVKAQGATPGEIVRFSRAHPELYQWIDLK